MSLSTEFLLLAQYQGRTVIPAEDVCRDFFSHLSPATFVRRVNEGDIDLPLLHIDGSAKSARGVHLSDLAAYIDARRQAAAKEAAQLAGRA